MQRNRGEIMEGVLILVFLAIVIFVFLTPSHGQGPLPSLGLGGTQNNNPSYSYSNPGTQNTQLKNSYYTGGVTLSQGNAASSIQPFEEYVTIQNYSQNPVDITGWTLSNAKGTRTYSVGGSDAHFASDVAVIPQAAPVISPGGVSALSDVILKPGETATVTTGNISNVYPFKIPSFKENECTGYLNDPNTYSYTFSSGMNSSCVYPSQEPGAQALDNGCQTFLNSLSSCGAAKIDTINSQGAVRDDQGNTCVGCVNGVAGLSNSCIAFIRNHYNYQGCLSTHINDPNFYGTTWHVYLGRQWEMWAADHETISLYDKQGKLVDYTTY